MIFNRQPGTTAGHSAATYADSPIFARLVQERGDVPTEVRRTAEEAWREVEQVMDFRFARRSVR